MSNVVITGGTDGIGQTLARTFLHRGDNVMIVGRDPGKGRAFLDAAGDIGASARAVFIQADLSLLDENAKVIERVTTRFSAVDALVLCARHHRSTRTETVDGFEENFALFYLSRYLLGHGLAATLEKAARPVIANVAGPGGTSRIQWNDLELRQNYHGTGALGHGGRLNDLLGVAFAKRYGAGGTRYLLFHPGVVSTSFSGEYDRTTAAAVEQLKKSGKPVREATASIINRIDNPPDEPLSAFIEGERISVETPLFDRRDANRLDDVTQRLLAQHE